MNSNRKQRGISLRIGAALWIIVPALLLILSLIPALCVQADIVPSESIPNYVKTNYSIDQGLPTDEANAIVQDHTGYIWIGGYGGLIRYDGSNFVDYSNNLESSAIRSLFVDAAGRLFIGTNDAGVYVMENDQFTQLSVPDSRDYLCIRRFDETSKGVVYAATTSGIVRVDEDQLTPISFEEFETQQFINIAVDSSDQIWALTDSSVVYVFTPDSYITSYSETDFFKKDIISSLCADIYGNIFISSSGDSLVKMTVSKEGTVENQDDLYATGLNSISKISPGSDGTVLLCGLRGFGFIDKEGKFQCVDKDVIDGNWAMIDHEGDYWVASSGSCLQRYCLGCFSSCNFNSTLGTMTANVVHRQGKFFYVGTDSGVFVYDTDWNQVNSKATRLLNGIRVRSINSDKDGRIWISAWNQGLVRFDPASGESTRFSTEEGLNSDKIRVIYRLSDGRMLLGDQQGASIMDKSGDTVEKSYTADDGMETTSVLSALELDGHIYLGTDGSGIYEITDDGLVHLGFDEGLTQGVVLRMTPDSNDNGNFFVCAGDKLFYYEIEKNSFRLLDGITKGAGSFYSIYDVGGRIWALQNSGIFSVDKAALLAGEDTYTAKYGPECGLTGSLAANTWCYMTEGVRLYIPTHSGVSAFSFEGKDVVMPRAIVNSITVDDQVYEHPTSVDVPATAKRVTADISLLLFSDMVDYDLAYRLDGFDQEDTVSSDRNVNISYTNLKGGEYNLKVKVINPLTKEVAQSNDVSIAKKTAFKETPLFWILIILLTFCVAFLIGYLILRTRLARAEKNDREQRKIINEALVTIASTIDAKDQYTKGHSVRVAEYSKEIARRMNKDQEFQEKIYYIGLLHDIGKIGVPDEVLNKKSRLTDEEFMLIKKHPAIGGDILHDFTSVKGIADGAKYHHERYDGRGYCEGLAGEDIPLVARIIGVADSYDAMQSNRVYRPGLTDEVILSELTKNAGTQFDPAIVPIMCGMIADGFAPIDIKEDTDVIDHQSDDQ